MSDKATISDSKTPESGSRKNFIREAIDADLESGRFEGRVQTRFPPEPNGYLHIGHAKSICLNFGIARDYGGRCNLRFDDTNPLTEEVEYVDSIKEDVCWLGFEWDEQHFASDYFEQLFEYAVQLIRMGKAYVDDLTAEEIREYRGTLTEPGKNSPYRDRSAEENLDLFMRMKNGEFEDGTHVLRAKIDMAHPNLVMRDPTLYRIRKAPHHRTGDKWVIYPMYDFTHCISDSLERVTHSLCTLEFEINRELYDWVLDQLDVYHPQQIEFARLNLSYTVLSKRRLIQLVRENHVDGWDDPRMPTMVGLRRRGIPPEAIRDFCDRIGVAKADNLVDIALLEHCVREELNRTAPRIMGVLNPIKATIENYPEGQVEWFEMPYYPDEPEKGTRQVPFSRTLYLEREDFREEAPKKFFRLAPGREVRLRYAYYVTCTDVIKDAEGNVTELILRYDPETKGGWSQDGRKVKGTLHWVSSEHALPCETRLYDRLFTVENPMDKKHGDFKSTINPDSLEVVTGYMEPSVADAEPGMRVQFERLGYFCVDSRDSRPGQPVFNRTVTLRDSWARIERSQKK
ncbi:glutamine--tRNA ligase [Oceanidesulfovibrio indonesiensis]|uniref:Glutamine--tRNA ligase n=1 Tax=Oceanidesulfovibrio indonesiensis TaxID=54767 RepID=A0A7M3MB89_9BACT|nr:glutamine--tRNA ligase/YqeY domain fusion protein [Oceanidesulfovibrio indonesiensis]TVM14844.1 glutamine--tRNA ligase [Oceanidesulfovibrio indonesiensis]